MARVDVEDGLVVLAPDRETDLLLLGADAADALAAALWTFAGWAEADEAFRLRSGGIAAPRRRIAQDWEANVSLFGSAVALRLNRKVSKLPLPPEKAREMARWLRLQAANHRRGYSFRLVNTGPA